MPQVEVAIVGGGPGGSSAGRRSLRLLFGIARVETWMRRRRGLPVESRLEW